MSFGLSWSKLNIGLSLQLWIDVIHTYLQYSLVFQCTSFSFQFTTLSGLIFVTSLCQCHSASMSVPQLLIPWLSTLFGLGNWKNDIYKVKVQSLGLLKENFLFRISKEIKIQQNFTKRFLWYMCQDLCLLANTWGYASLAIAFTFAPSNYQWILGLFIPLPKILYLKLLLFVCNKSAGSGPNGKSSIKLLMVHFTEAKQCIFCAMIVGSVATSETTKLSYQKVLQISLLYFQI